MKLCVIVAAALFLVMQAMCGRAAGPKAVSLLEQGQCYKQAGEHVKAFDSFADGLVAAMAEGDDRTAMRCAGNISIIYHNFGDVENSLYFAHKGYEMAERLGDGAQVTFLLNFVSFYTNAADTANAAKYYRMLHKAMPMSDNVVTRYFLMYERARLLRTQGRYAEAAGAHAAARKFAVEHRMPGIYVLFQDSELGNLMVTRADWKGALGMGRHCLDEAVRMNERDMVINACKMLADAFAGMGVSDSADRYRLKYYELRAEVYDMEGFFRVHNKLMRYKDSMAEGRISRLSAVMVVGAVLTLMLVALAVALVRRNVSLRKVQMLLVEKNRQLMAVENSAAAAHEGGACPGGLPQDTCDDDVKQAGAAAHDGLQDRIVAVLEDTSAIADPDFSLSALAAKVGSNTKYVSTVINRMYNKNFKTLLSEYRVREACRRLSCADYDRFTIKAIACGVGFRNTVSFIRCFKNVMGMTPSVYQKLSRKKEG